MAEPDYWQVINKFRRCREHLASIDFAVSEYIDSQPYEICVDEDSEAECYRVRVIQRYPPPARLSLVAADFLSNAQGALDHIAWQLLIDEGQRGGRKTVFPIERDEPVDENGAKIGVNIKDHRWRPCISSPYLLEALNKVQPYQDGENAAEHPLWVLRTLNGECKHRQLIVLAAFISRGIYAYKTHSDPDFPRETFQMTLAEGRIKDGDYIATVPFADANGPPPPNAGLTTQVTVEQVSHTGDRPELIRVMTDICNAVEAVITGFARHLGHSPGAMRLPDSVMHRG